MQRDSRHRTGRSTCTDALRCPPHDRRPLQALENFSWFGWMLDSPRSLGSGQAGRRPRLGSRVLRQAGDVYDRAARSPYGRVPQPTPAGNQPRHAARLLSAFACLIGCGSIISIVLVTRVGRARRSRRRTPRRPAGRRPGRRRSRRRRTAVRRRALDTACPADPAPDTACPARRTVFPASFTTRDTRTAPTEPRADRHECDGCQHPGHVGLPADDASTHSPVHQTVMSCSVIRGWLSDDPDMGSAPT